MVWLRADVDLSTLLFLWTTIMFYKMYAIDYSSSYVGPLLFSRVLVHIFMKFKCTTIWLSRFDKVHALHVKHRVAKRRQDTRWKASSIVVHH
jgi:hypothetical protein